MRVGRDQGISGKLGAGTTSMVFITGSLCSACCHRVGEPRLNLLLSLGDLFRGQSLLSMWLAMLRSQVHSLAALGASQRGEKESIPSPAVMGGGKNTSNPREREVVFQAETRALLGKENKCWQSKMANANYSTFLIV